MGYSHSHFAGLLLENITSILKEVHGGRNANSWGVGGGAFKFYEIGKENVDGSITGKVHKVGADGFIKTSSSFKITKDDIIRFPYTTKAQRDKAFHQAIEEFKVIYPELAWKKSCKKAGVSNSESFVVF